MRTFQYTVPFGVVRHENERVTAIEEKPTIGYEINAGIYCLSNETIRMAPREEYYDMPTLVGHLIERNKLCSLVNLSGFWIDIGTHEEYHRANAYYSI